MLINVKVNTQKEEKITKISESEYKIDFKAQREKGKANLKLIGILSKYFNTAKNNIKIIKGFTSKNKIIEIKC
jgi:uncharacterized protein